MGCGDPRDSLAECTRPVSAHAAAQQTAVTFGAQPASAVKSAPMLEHLWSLLDRWLWSARAEGRGPLGLLLRVLRYPFAVLRDLVRGQINLRAMGLVYATTLSMIPLLAFSFAILKFFGAQRDLEPIIYEFFRPVGSGATELTARVMGFVDSVSSGLVGSVGFALLLWTLIGTIRKVEDSFNFLWRVEQPRSFARRVAEYLSLIIIGPLLLVGFIGLAHAAMDSAPLQQLSGSPSLHGAFSALLALAPYAMVTVIFTGLYLFVPNTGVHWAAAMIGGVAAGVLWAAVGSLFTAFVVYSSRLTIVYAGFAVIVAALLWTYFGWLILLVGARLTFYLQNPGDLRLGLMELRLSSVELEDLTLKIMYLVGQAHLQGKRRWRVDALAHKLGLPGIAVAQVVEALEASGLITATDADQLLPARDIGSVQLREILDVARNQRSGNVGPTKFSVAAVDRLSRSLSDARRTSCGERSLRDLIEEPA